MATRPAATISIPSAQPLATTGAGKAISDQGGWRSAPLDATTIPSAANQPKPDSSPFDNLVAIATPAESAIGSAPGLAAPARSRAAA
jgi:hypothetical protein